MRCLPILSSQYAHFILGPSSFTVIVGSVTANYNSASNQGQFFIFENLSTIYHLECLNATVDDDWWRDGCLMSLLTLLTYFRAVVLGWPTSLVDVNGARECLA